MLGMMIGAALAAGGKDMVEERPLSPPVVIAHRGASGSRPEHTLSAYRLAIEQGADFIEPDLVLTKDDVFVARHENEISETTDVAAHPEYAARRTTKVIDGRTTTGWFTEDFTLAELRTLRTKERLPQLRPGNVAYDGRDPVPTLAEVIALAQQASRDTGRTIGIYPETKHPSYFAGIGHPMEDRLVAQLRAAGWDSATAPVFIQSFEVANLKRLKTLTPIRLIQLIDAGGHPADDPARDYATMTTPAGLAAVARYAWGIGPNRSLVADGAPLIRDAHRAGLRVHPWTYRAENVFLPDRYRAQGGPGVHGRVGQEIADAVAAGVDGFFTDFPLIGAQVRDAPY